MDASTLGTLVQAVLAQTGQAAAAAADTAQAASGNNMQAIVALAAAAFAISFGVIGAALSEGYATAKACESIARNPQAAGAITRAMLIGQAITESTAIYALLISLLILLFAR